MATPRRMIQQTVMAIVALLSVTSTYAQEKITRAEYINRWADVAIEHMEVYGIPASITMAQAILESGSGNSRLARQANNHFGIKCGNNWEGEVIYHDDDEKGECFRAYSSADESFADHAEFLHTRTRYDFLFDYAPDDYTNWAKGLKQAGYATSPTYAEGLIKIIEEESLYLLDRKDGRKHYNDYLAQRYGIAAPTKDKDDESRPTPPASHVGKDQTLAYADRGIDPNNFRITINSHFGYNVYLTNGANYIIARQGDSYKSLGKLFEIPHQLLRKFNDATKEDELSEGDIVYIERKASRWRGDNLLHRVSKGEDLRLIAQIYGVRLKALRKLNKLDSKASIAVDDTIRLR